VRDRGTRLGRRGLLKAVLGGAMAGLMGAGPARAAKIRRKVSKAQARYQDHPMDVRACAACTLFVAPDACKAVRGKVSPDGWCNLFDLAD
jgi:hypothetical protein